MKTVKYVLLALLVASTGLSAMEPIQQNERALALHESLEDQGLTLPNGLAQNIVEYAEAQEKIDRAYRARIAQESGSERAYVLRRAELPEHVAQNAVEYAEAQEKIDQIQNEKVRKERKERIDNKFKYSFSAMEASLPIFAATGVSFCQEAAERSYIPFLSAAALFSTGLMYYGKLEKKNDCHCTTGAYSADGHCQHSRNGVMSDLGLGLLGSSILPVLSIPLYPFYALLGKKRTANFGAKAVSASLVPFFGSGLLQSSDSKSALLNGIMLAASGMLTYSGIQDIIKYKNSDYTSFSKFVVNNGKNLNEQDA